MKLLILQKTNQANFSIKEREIYADLFRQKEAETLKAIREYEFLSKAKTVNDDLQRITTSECEYFKGKFNNKVVYVKRFLNDKMLGNGLAIIVDKDFNYGDGMFGMQLVKKPKVARVKKNIVK